MAIYIDKENLCSLVENSKKIDDSDYTLRRYAEIAKKEIIVKYNFDKSELFKDEKLKLWARYVWGQGVESDYSFLQEKCPQRPLSNKCILELIREDPSGILLLNDENIDDLLMRNCVLVSKLGNELELFDRIKKNIEEDGIPISPHNLRWDKFCPILPTCEIILVDPYYFSIDPKKIKEGHKGLLYLGSIARDFPVNIVVIVLDNGISQDIENEIRNIKVGIQKKSGNKDVNVTVVVKKKNGSPGDVIEIHDRHYITNYYYLPMGKGESNVREKSNVSNERKSVLKKSTRLFVRNKLLSLYNEMIEKKQYHRIYGDKISNLIKFK